MFFFSKTEAINQLHAWKLLPRPERLTELYFTNHARLPATFKPNGSQTLTFTVHNLEQQTTEYHYKLIARSGATNVEQVLGNGKLTLAPDQSQDITRTIVVPPLARRIQIRVSLEYGSTLLDKEPSSLQTQAIHYWVAMIAKDGTKEGPP